MKPARFHSARLAWIIVLITATLIQILYDPISSIKHSRLVSRTRAELPRARAKWEASGITDYTFEIQGNARSICQPSAVIEVRGNVVVRVETRDFTSDDSPAQILPPDKWADPDWGEEVFLCSYTHFTMPQIFDLIDETLRNFPSSIMYADFDSEYGFPSKFSFGIYAGYGLLRPKLGNCCHEFQIRNFQPLAGP
ncbi:MAG TPA: DUF6174 domain-containing protein [Anaerolineales bacterium]|nr:DUF6174 domain-containing protein [Anaerolineales bacterium]